MTEQQQKIYKVELNEGPKTLEEAVYEQESEESRRVWANRVSDVICIACAAIVMIGIAVAVVVVIYNSKSY